MSDLTVENIEQLLEDERTALLSGDLAALESIAERKDSMLNELATGTRPAGDALKSLRRKAERNAELLEAAIKGLRSAMRRVSEIRRANGPLRTYGQDGAQRTLGSAGGTFERRA